MLPCGARAGRYTCSLGLVSLFPVFLCGLGRPHPSRASRDPPSPEGKVAFAELAKHMRKRSPLWQFVSAERSVKGNDLFRPRCARPPSPEGEGLGGASRNSCSLGYSYCLFPIPYSLRNSNPLKLSYARRPYMPPMLRVDSTVPVLNSSPSTGRRFTTVIWMSL